ncbi:protein CASC4 isoform X2 [Gouania willdenowi]|uniref:protein CASC4 isoform X2 n=1 Tax=Gouania willdenowi TaxID=441366 RepID=UPI001056391D|nr:protein CASC4 isoform X2 [Gouania willdenowi]
MIGFGANRRAGRLPSFILIFLTVVIAILAFNYWTVSSKHGRLLDELAEAQSQAKRTDAARSRLEKRNSELIMQVDTHRKQISQNTGDYNVLQGELRTKEAELKECTDEKLKVQDEVTGLMTEIQKLKEQLKELKQEFMKQEEQMREVKKNSTTLERKLEYEGLQCGRQIAQLKDEYEETKKTLEEEALKLKKSIIDGQQSVISVRHAEGAAAGELIGERHTVATHHLDRQADLKEEMGKPGSDAGMPGIEDSEVGKIEDVQFSLKKTAIMQEMDKISEVVVGAGAGPGPGAADGLGVQNLSLDQPKLQQERLDEGAAVMAVPGLIKVVDKPIVFEEVNKVGVKTDEQGEQQRQLQGPDKVIKDSGLLKRIPLPPNPAQVPNPIQSLHNNDKVAAEPVHHRQSRYFDENESPVDPHHGSKLADYNGDDGNVDDEDRELQGDRGVDYGKRHQGNDVL